MNGKLTFIIFYILGICALKITAEDDFFKVPLEIREKNRPQRLVDNSDDPDMRVLKDIQDKFFNIVGNSSVGKEFKSFKQLLHLVDSKAGIELGRLMFQGVMIAYGKDNSNQLLNEFIDDFQYRVSPNLADALIDYKDFLKTVDLKMIPLTLQTLFRKDELGNSLAQMPLGQLVDLVQPEASKYGIDIKAVINGILGKGDSTFPDMVKKALDNFDIATILKNLQKSGGSKSSEETNQVGASADEKRQRKDLKNPALMLFKPFISNMLKENKIDLDPDAVIQVLTPFVAPLLQSFMPSGADKDGKQQGKFDFSQIMPMLTLLGSQFGESKKGPKKQERSVESEPSGTDKLEGQTDKKDSTENVMGIVSGLLQMSDNMKKGKIDDSEGGKQQDLLQLAMTLMGNMGGKDKSDDSMANLLNLAAGALQMSNANGKQSDDPSANTMQLLQSAMSLMGNAGDKKSKENPLNGLIGLASTFMDNKKDGKGGDQMANLLGLASTFLGGDKKDDRGGAQMANLLGLASAFMGKNKDGKAGDPMAGILGIMSSFMDNNNGKIDIIQIINSILGGPNGKDVKAMVKMAAALFGTGKNKRKHGQNAIAEDPEVRKAKIEERKIRLAAYKEAIKADPRYKAAKENVQNVLSDIKKMKNETASQVSEEAVEIVKEIIGTKDEKEERKSYEKFDRTKSFPYALETFFINIQQDKNVHSKIQQLFSYARIVISNKFRNRKEFEDYLELYLSPYDSNLKVQALTAPFFLTEKQFDLFVGQLTKEEFSTNSFITQTTGETIKRLLDKKINSNIATAFSHQLSAVITNFGIKDVTFENFPDKLSVILTALSQNQGLPINVDQLLRALQYSLRSIFNWYNDEVLRHSSSPENELQDIFIESSYNEVVLPLKRLWKIRQVSKSSKSCLPREVCEFVNKIDEDRVVENLMSTIGSIIYGGYVAESERNPELFIQTVLASVYKGSCKEVFPLSCDKKVSKTVDDDDDFRYDHIEL